MRGLKVAVPKVELPPAEDGEYYWSDLIGMDVINAEGLCLGKVVDLMDTGANDVLVISGEHGQILIPFVAAYVGDVDTQSKQIKVEWGLDY
jgi:16S rRNA processing protein RimM